MRCEIILSFSIFSNSFFILFSLEISMFYRGEMCAFSQNVFHCECNLVSCAYWVIFVFKYEWVRCVCGQCIIETVLLPIFLLFLNFCHSPRISLILKSLLFVSLFRCLLSFSCIVIVYCFVLSRFCGWICLIVLWRYSRPRQAWGWFHFQSADHSAGWLYIFGWHDWFVIWPRCVFDPHNRSIASRNQRSASKRLRPHN